MPIAQAADPPIRGVEIPLRFHSPETWKRVEQALKTKDDDHKEALKKKDAEIATLKAKFQAVSK